MARIGIAAIADPVTTARYLERAAVAEGYTVVAVHDFDDQDVLDGLDCLIICDPFLPNPGQLRKVVCPVVGFMIDVHRTLAPRLAYARYLDHVFVAQLEYVDAFSKLPHPSVTWLPLACDADVHFAGIRERHFDVGFVGKLGDVRSERRLLLEHVLGQFSTNDFRRHYDMHDMGGIYSRSKIVLNRSIGGDLNMRFFEALASGALLVTDHIGNGLDRIGRDGEHYVTYRSVDEAIDKIRHYLSNDEEREVIARRGQVLAFKHHTYRHRLTTIMDAVNKSSEQWAPARLASSDTEAVWRSELMLLNGASLSEVWQLLWLEGNWTVRTIGNSGVAVARGVVRPMRRSLADRARAWN